MTGGSTGIGLLTAKHFVEEGAYVYITGRNPGSLGAAVQQIGSRVTAVQSDVSQLTDLDLLYDTVAKRHSRIDVRFATAGVVQKAPLGHIARELFDNSLNLNVKGVLFTV